ncbi:MAG TPA: ABC transporter permease [Firmicutes bacterium]|nr:ABC transporter permease [Bacillota bacterium]HBK68638.1 ABC transporter permease [Bacillota bacterium]HBT18314.1 ABC transporter permease [Bacillota bacterium]
MPILRRNRKIFTEVFKYIFAFIILIGTLAPFLWLIISSISPEKELLAKPLQWIPSRHTFQRYVSIFTESENNKAAYVFRQAMGNSIKVALSVVVISLISGTIAAYSFARLKFRFKNKIIMVFLFTYMIPPVAIIIALFTILNELNLIDTLLGLTILYSSFTTPFVVWIMKGYMQSIPGDLEDAARIDGCSRLKALTRVILPLALPGLIATGILVFLLSWEEFFYALIFTSSVQAKTISVAISEFSGRHAVDYGMIATGGVLATLPPVILTLFFQRYIISGLTAGGVKG